MFQERNVFWFLEPFAGERLEWAIDLVGAVGEMATDTNLEPLFEVREINVMMETVVVEFVEYRSSNLVRF